MKLFTNSPFFFLLFFVCLNEGVSVFLGDNCLLMSNKINKMMQKLIKKIKQA